MVEERLDFVISADTRKGREAIKAFRRTLKGTAADSKQAGEQGTTGFQQFGGAILSVKNLVGAFGITLGAVQVANVIRQWASETVQFQMEMANVSTLLDTNVVDMGRMQQELIALGGQLGSSTDLARGLYQALSAGQDPANAVEFVGQAAKFATAALTDTHTAVDVLTTVLNAYGLEAERAGYVSDVLFEIIKQGKTTGPELSGTLGRVIPVAAALGVGLEEVGAILAGLTKSGLATDEAVTSLRQVMVSFLNPQEQAVKLAQDLNVELSAQAVQTKGLLPALAELAAASQGNAEATSTFFGNVRALTGVLAVTRDQEEFVALLDRMHDSLNNVNEAAEKQLLTIGKQMGALWNNITNSFLGAATEGTTAAKALKAINDEIERQIRDAPRVEQTMKRINRYQKEQGVNVATAREQIRQLVDQERHLERLHGELSTAIRETNQYIAEGNDKADVSLARTRALQGNLERLVEEYKEQQYALDELNVSLPELVLNRQKETKETNVATEANEKAREAYGKLRAEFMGLLNPGEELLGKLHSLGGEFSEHNLVKAYKDEILAARDAYVAINRPLPESLKHFANLADELDAMLDAGTLAKTGLQLQDIKKASEDLNKPGVTPEFIQNIKAAGDAFETGLTPALSNVDAELILLSQGLSKSADDLFVVHGAMDTATKKTNSLTDAISDQVSTIKTDFSRALVSIRHDWEGFWDALKSVADAALDALLRLVIEKGVEKLGTLLGNILVGASQTSGGGSQPWWKKVLGGIGTVLGGTTSGGGSPGATGQPPSPFWGTGSFNPFYDPTFGYLPPISGEGYQDWMWKVGLSNEAINPFLEMMTPGRTEMDLMNYINEQAALAEAYNETAYQAGKLSDATELYARETSRAREETERMNDTSRQQLRITERVTEEMRALAYWGIDATSDAFERGGQIWTDILGKGESLSNMIYGLGSKLMETREASEAQSLTWQLLGKDIVALAEQYNQLGIQLPPLIEQALNWAAANDLVSGSILSVNDTVKSSLPTLEDYIEQGKSFMEIMEIADRQGVRTTPRSRTTAFPRFRGNETATIPGYVAPGTGTVIDRPEAERRGTTIVVNGDVYGYDDFQEKVGEAWTDGARTGSFARTGRYLD